MAEAERLPRNDNLDLKGSLRYDRKPIRFTVTCPGSESYVEFRQETVNLAGIDLPKGGGSYMVELESVEFIGERITDVGDVNGLDELSVSILGMKPEYETYSALVETDGLCEAPRLAGGAIGNITTHSCTGTLTSYDPTLVKRSTAPNLLVKTMGVVKSRPASTSSINPILSTDSNYINFSYRLKSSPGFRGSFGEEFANDVPDSVINNRSLKLTFLLYPSPYYYQSY